MPSDAFSKFVGKADRAQFPRLACTQVTQVHRGAVLVIPDFITVWRRDDLQKFEISPATRFEQKVVPRGKMAREFD